MVLVVLIAFVGRDWQEYVVGNKYALPPDVLRSAAKCEKRGSGVIEFRNAEV